ncbi:hypothetical protein GOODEAATRI_011703 [Goodea atripinnis]|uniref:Uncharacterized protein n=1 Tax=Goodea atripinnis TaxID=208336 RepID=A0ABV0N0L4_9TELE
MQVLLCTSCWTQIRKSQQSWFRCTFWVPPALEGRDPGEDPEFTGGTFGLHGGVAGSTIALRQEDSGFDSWLGVFLHGVCMFSLCMHGFSLGTLASSHSSKT